jgi:hypothetical protein
LEEANFVKKPIQGIHWYTILANPHYCAAFNYISCARTDRDNLIVDNDSDEDNDCDQSDYVKLILNFGYLFDELTSTIEVNKGICKEVKGFKLAKRILDVRMKGFKIPGLETPAE